MTPSKTTAIHLEPSIRKAVGALCAVVAAMVTACGGGGDGNAPASGLPPPPAPAPLPAPAPPPPPPAPVVRDYGWRGALGAVVSEPTPRKLVLATSADSHYLLAVYGVDADTDFKARGLLEAYATASSPTRYMGVAGTGLVANVDLTVSSDSQVISGTLLERGELKPVVGGGSAAVGYRFDQPASMAAVAGRWELSTSEGRNLSIDIDPQGVVTGTSGSCALYESKVAPTSTGYGVFAITLRFRVGAFACSEPHGGSDGVHGFAVVYPLQSGETQLVVGAANGWDPVYLAAAGKR